MPAPDRQTATMISFIVPAYNEELLIGRALSGIHLAARARAHPYEIIVVDDGSTDRTATLAGGVWRPGRHRASPPDRSGA